MPLTLMQVGEKGIIRKISGGEDTRRYLGNLGFVSQASLIALNADMARHIMVNI